MKNITLLKIREEFFDGISPEIFITSAIDNIENYKNFYINKYNSNIPYQKFIYVPIEFKKNDLILKLDETQFEIDKGLKLKFIKIFYKNIFWISDCYFIEA